jgi:hypothetical protein
MTPSSSTDTTSNLPAALLAALPTLSSPAVAKRAITTMACRSVSPKAFWFSMISSRSWFLSRGR